jgi:energy-coupling factor transporter ATP-binding protein EcfA2
LERLDLYQLHAPDPRTPLSTSIRALASLKRDGLIEAIGLCNVTVGQLEQARRIAEITSVQVELSIWNDDHLLSGVVSYCLANRLQLLAHRPLGGPSRRGRTRADPTLAAVARRHDVGPFEVARAWLMDLSDLIMPIPGATRVETVESIARSRLIRLTDEDREQLGRLLPAVRAIRYPAQGRQVSTASASLQTGEIALVMGLPAAGKSTFARSLVATGYHRLNRDEAGGSLRQLLPALDAAISSGATRVVLDNTYVSRKSRAQVIQAAAAADCRFAARLSTSIEDAQTNAAWRIVSRYASCPTSGARPLRARDVAAFCQCSVPVSAPARAARPVRGFSRIDVVPFDRHLDPSFVNRAVIICCGCAARSRLGLRVPLMPEDVEAMTDRAVVLRRYREEGYQLLGISWQPEIADGKQSAEGVAAIMRRMCDLLGVDIEVEYCPHAAGPPACWCRKPLPGLGVQFVQRHRLDPSQCIYVGSGPQDPGFARRLGFIYREASDFFA